MGKILCQGVTNSSDYQPQESAHSFRWNAIQYCRARLWNAIQYCRAKSWNAIQYCRARSWNAIQYCRARPWNAIQLVMQSKKTRSFFKIKNHLKKIPRPKKRFFYYYFQFKGRKVFFDTLECLFMLYTSCKTLHSVCQLHFH